MQNSGADRTSASRRQIGQSQNLLREPLDELLIQATIENAQRLSRHLHRLETKGLDVASR
jgi:hypothetical protein